MDMDAKKFIEMGSDKIMMMSTRYLAPTTTARKIIATALAVSLGLTPMVGCSSKPAADAESTSSAQSQVMDSESSNSNRSSRTNADSSVNSASSTSARAGSANSFSATKKDK